MRNDSLDARLTEFCEVRHALTAPRTTVIGVNGPQGCGKSTLVSVLVERLAAKGLKAVAVSIDDFYLTRSEQQALAARHPGNRALEHRGYPGTHDVELGVMTLDSLLGRRPTEIPRYDKSAHAGRGDRAPRQSWPIVDAVDVVLFEGWMLGFRPLEDARSLPEDLKVPNDSLHRYAAWTDRLDAMVALVAPSLEQIVAWRVDAERARREGGQATLSDDEVRDYIERFLPAYRAWSSTVHADVRLSVAANRYLNDRTVSTGST